MPRRLVVHDSRSIHLAWHRDREAYEIRLMYGQTYLTPRVEFTPLDWYTLLTKRAVKLGGWIGFRLEGNSLHVGPLRSKEGLDIGSTLCQFPVP